MARPDHSLSAAGPASLEQTAVRRWAAAFLIVESLLILAPLIILGAAIDWPASLDQPAAVNLPLILEKYAAVMTGYSFYLVYSLLFWPMAYLAGRAVVGDAGPGNSLFWVATGFAALSVLARALGIVRWLFAMPVLARSYLDPAASAGQKESIALVYETLNAYAGGIGELLGVNLLGAVWIGLVSIMILRSALWPRWVAWFGLLVAALLLSNLLEMVGYDMGAMLTATGTIQHLWMLALAIVLLRKKPDPV